MMVRNVVVFPAPLRPMRQTSSPATTDRLMPLRMRLPSISTFRPDRFSIVSTLSKPLLKIFSQTLLSSSWTSSHDRGNHRGIGKERVGRHVAKERTCLQGDDAMGVTLHEVHVMLDLHDGADARRLGCRDKDFHDRVL